MSELLEYNKLSCKYYNTEKEMRLVKRLCRGFNGKKILDVGCGIGRIIPFVLCGRGEYHGIDTNKEFVGYAKKKYKNVDIREASAEKIPFDNGYFDIVVCSWVLTEVSDLKKSLSECKRVLKKSGVFVSVEGTLVGDYGKIIEIFAKQLSLGSLKYFSSLRKILLLKFGNLKGPFFANIPYKFPDIKTASKEIASEIEDIERIKLKQSDRVKIKDMLKKYKNKKRVIINERVAFDVCEKV